MRTRKTKKQIFLVGETYLKIKQMEFTVRNTNDTSTRKVAQGKKKALQAELNGLLAKFQYKRFGKPRSPKK